MSADSKQTGLTRDEKGRITGGYPVEENPSRSSRCTQSLVGLVEYQNS